MCNFVQVCAFLNESAALVLDLKHLKSFLYWFW